jgi:hypothetical protein
VAREPRPGLLPITVCPLRSRARRAGVVVHLRTLRR